MKASDIITRAQELLLDTKGTRWTPDELRGYLTEAQLKLVDLRPQAFSTERDIDLVPGSSQPLPTDMLYLLDVVSNVKVPELQVTRVELRDLDTTDPAWRNKPGDGTIYHYAYNPNRHPDLFYVYPAIPEGITATIRILASTAPPDITKKDEELPLRDRYRPALLDYVIYRAYQKDNEEPENRARSNEAYNRFLASLGLKVEKQ